MEVDACIVIQPSRVPRRTLCIWNLETSYKGTEFLKQGSFCQKKKEKRIVGLVIRVDLGI